MDGTAWLLSFPFWIIVDTDDPPTIVETAIDGIHVRFYPPFRSGLADFTPMPAVDPAAIPFVEGHPNISAGYKMPKIVIYPKLAAGATGHEALIVMSPVWEERPRAFPMDSLRFDTYASNGAQEVNDEVIALSLLQQLRVRTRQWWITHSSDLVQSYCGNCFKVQKDGAAIGKLAALRNFRTPSGSEIALTNSMWTAAVSDVAAGRLPSTSDILLLDLQCHLAEKDFRRLVIDAATACEMERDLAIERAARKSSRGRFRRGKDMPGSDLQMHISIYLDHVSGRSYEREFPNQYQSIGELWYARGEVAHGRPAIYRRSGSVIKVDGVIANSFLHASQHCVEWLRGI